MEAVESGQTTSFLNEKSPIAVSGDYITFRFSQEVRSITMIAAPLMAVFRRTLNLELHQQLSMTEG